MFKVVFLFLGLFHALVCPFTKVEESFNAQAIHDVNFIYMQTKGLEGFDHFEFPGVVPRTFIGAWIVSFLSLPIYYVSSVVGPVLLEGDQVRLTPAFLTLISYRMTIVTLIWVMFGRLADGLEKRFGKDVARWFYAVCCCQFHLVFYMGRPLPNTFALGICAYALGKWLEGSWEECIAYLVFCTVVFRCDTIILLGIVTLTILLKREASILAMFVDGVSTGFVSLTATVAFDSAMWWKLLWPEGMVLFFNTVMNKSKEWGVMPFHWYFTSALPRALLVSYPLALLAVFTPISHFGKVPRAEKQTTFQLIMMYVNSVLDIPAITYLFIPAFGYTLLYSILPHKEVRFLFQVFPFFNSLAALTLAKFERSSMNVRQGTFRLVIGRLALGLSILGLVASFAVASAYLAVSERNYPGAEALLHLQRYHNQHHPSKEAKAHYCTFAAMSGITRFLEYGAPKLIYSKQEDEPFLATICNANSPFHYLITEIKFFESNPACQQHYNILETFQGSPVLNWRQQAVETQPVLYLLERK